MPKRNAEAIRPSSILHAFEVTWRVTGNDTLDRLLELESIDPPHRTKRVRYQPGQEIFLRWEPFDKSKIYDR